MNQKGELEKFSAQKASDERQKLEESVRHLEQQLKDISTANNKNHEVLVQRVEAHVGERISDQKFLTWGFMKKVNDAVSSIFSFVSPPASPRGSPTSSRRGSVTMATADISDEAGPSGDVKEESKPSAQT